LFTSYKNLLDIGFLISPRRERVRVRGDDVTPTFILPPRRGRK